MRSKLDNIDLHIIAGLQLNSRMPNVELAERVGISPPLCLRRVRALEVAGYLKGYYADVDAKALGFGITIFTQVGLGSHAERDLKAFVELVATWPLVRECHMLTGRADFLLKIVVENWAAYQAFLTTNLSAAPNINHLKSALAIRTCKLAPGVPIAFEQPP